MAVEAAGTMYRAPTTCGDELAGDCFVGKWRLLAMT